MSRDTERAEMICQRKARSAGQLLTNAIDPHVQGEQRKDDEGPAGALLAG